ncbi:MAG: prolyl oligopeptidase family serine peptidase [Proteobacteria bacterium]|nr:prolyl oligopeptidase family serine peptidase [Pseudomonadota bacterium]
MFCRWAGIIALVVVVGGCAGGVRYPVTVSGDQVDVYHGVRVADPYRWLEDDVRESAEVRDWVARQNEVARGYLDGIAERGRIRDRLSEIWDFEKFTNPVARGGRYFYRHNSGLQDQYVVLMQEGLEGEARMIVDPNTWSVDGSVALAGYVVSPDGRYLAMLVQESGSDWRAAQVFDIQRGELLTERLEWLKFTGLSWAGDSSGFYYSRYPAPEQSEQFQATNQNHAVYFHRLGDTQSTDRLVHSDASNPERLHSAIVTDDGRYLVVRTATGSARRHQVVYYDLKSAPDNPIILVPDLTNDYTFVGSTAKELYFRTDLHAPKGRLVAFDATRAPSAREVVGEEHDVLEGASVVGNRLVTVYLKDARSVVRIYQTDGTLAGEVALPGLGSVYGFDGSAESTETFFTYHSFNTPPTVNRLDVSTGTISVFKEPKVLMNPEDYAVRQVFYTSRDGTRVPMFIAHRKDVKPGKNTPTLLYGYGGFNISMTPGYSVTRVAWMDMGGVYAVANLRGGGEYGEAWHQAGSRLNKQNVFDDFIAAAEYLIHNDYTSAPKLAITGGSNGGLLVGAVTNQRPDLFGSALPDVGVMDMLRYHHFTAGRFWVDDYGSSDNADEFAALYAYSPYHNIVRKKYPAVLVTTADTDDRVVPGHSFKYAAALQQAQAGSEPVLIRIESKAGHGSGVPTNKVIDAYADRWAFLVRNLDFEPR